MIFTESPLIGLGENWRIDVLPASVRLANKSGILVPENSLRVLTGHNKITTAGINWIRDRINNGAADSMTHMARGSNNTAASASDTTLNTETERDALTSTTISPEQIAYQYLEPATANNGQTFREAGLFNAASGGTMLNRWTHPDVVKSSSIQILYTVTLTLSEV